MWLITGGSNTVGDRLQAIGMRRHGQVDQFHPSALGRLAAALAQNKYVIGGIVAMAVGFFALLSLLSIADLSFAVPATSASLAASVGQARQFRAGAGTSAGHALRICAAIAARSTGGALARAAACWATTPSPSWR